MTLGVTLAVGLLTPAFAQQVAPPESEAKVLDSSAADPRLRESETAERVVLLTPFEVSADDSDGYRASSSLAGTRLKMDLANIGSAISVLTEEFIADVGATDNQSLLGYGLNTEVGGPRGNFVNPDSFGLENQNLAAPNNNTRVRGLTSADNTRNYYITDIPWDAYIVNRIDIQRGANSILFGIGSPAGIINATTFSAGYYNSGKFQIRFDGYGSVRTNVDYNAELIPGELAVRGALLYSDQKFQQDPAYEENAKGFATVTWTPKKLNPEGTSFKFRAWGEMGDGKSNRPRMVVPGDQISPWFTPDGESGFEGEYKNFADWGLGGRLVNQITENGIATAGSGQANYTPWIGTTFAGPEPFLIYNETSQDFQQFVEHTASSRGSWYWETAMGTIPEGGTEPPFTQAQVNDGRDANGNGVAEVQRTVRAPVEWIIWGKNRAAADGGLPFQGFWKDSSFTDTTYFDFYNNLLDGDTKEENMDYTTFELDLANTFLDDMIGYNLGYFYQDFSTRFDANMGAAFVPAITVNIGELARTATQNNQIANPYAGRAYAIATNHTSGRTDERKRTSARAQGFIAYDFADKSDGWVSKLLGTQEVVGLLQKRTLDQDTSSFNPWGIGRDWILERGEDSQVANIPPAGSRWAEYAQNAGQGGGDIHVYLGHDGSGVRGLQSVQKINIPHGTFGLEGFDATPNAGFSATDAIQPWVDPWEIIPGTETFQSRNPENYRGWTTVGNYQIVSARESEAAREYLTVSKSQFTEDNDSGALVWTGKFWDGALVGLFGWRRDDVTESWAEHDYRTDGADAAVTFADPSTRSTSTDSTNWSISGNITQMIGMRDRSPVQLYLLYSRGEVQTPDPTRVDVFGRTLENAEGSTEDASIMLVGKESKWSLRVTKYETEVINAVSNSSVNREKWRIEQTLSQGAFRAGLVETGAQDYTADWLPVSASAAAAGYTSEGLYRKEVMAPAWRAMEKDMWEQYPLTQGWYISEFQPGDTSAPQIRFPDGSTLVEDQISRGWEFEFTANPTPGWTISANASQTEAIKDNLPGRDFGEVVHFLADRLEGPAGELPIWWNQGPGMESWMNPFLGEIAVVEELNGSVQPEIREWRANVVTNYQFLEGTLKGWGVGGAYRYEDGQVYGYEPYMDSEGAMRIDLEQSYSDSSRSTVDLWVSYGMQLTEKLQWEIQLNVFNAFGSNEVVPLHRNPDGSFGTMGIREGTSWALTNTFNF